jgi:alkylated DNA nucleotide flippase Atl1
MSELHLQRLGIPAGHRQVYGVYVPVENVEAIRAYAATIARLVGAPTAKRWVSQAKEAQWRVDMPPLSAKDVKPTNQRRTPIEELKIAVASAMDVDPANDSDIMLRAGLVMMATIECRQNELEIARYTGFPRYDVRKVMDRMRKTGKMGRGWWHVFWDRDDGHFYFAIDALVCAGILIQRGKGPEGLLTIHPDWQDEFQA